MVDAQGSRLSGVVYHVTVADSLALPGRDVVLHEARGSSGTIVDSTSTDRNGRFLFSVPSPDASIQYFVSVEHHAIGYFSSALALGVGETISVPTIVVYDTSYSRPTIVLHERHIIVREADTDGTRQIIELITLDNGGRFTRIAEDTSGPVWQGELPAGATQVAIGESEVGTGAVYEREGRLAIAAPIPPGEKQVLFSYIVPRNRGQLNVPIDQEIGRLTISMEDTTAVAVGGGLALYGVENVGGAFYKRYDAGNLTVGNQITVQFQQELFSIARLKIAVVVAVVLALSGTLTWWLRKQGPTTAP